MDTTIPAICIHLGARSFACSTTRRAPDSQLSWFSFVVTLLATFSILGMIRSSRRLSILSTLLFRVSSDNSNLS